MEQSVTTPLIIAHRGSSAIAPENTLASFEQALEDGSDGIEFDVRITRDEVPVVFHDASLERVTGSGERIAALTLADLASVDVGTWFNRGNAQYASDRYSGERIPTLESALSLLRGFRGPVYVELKVAVGRADLFSAAVARVLNRYSGSHLIVKSFDFQLVSKVKKKCPDIETAALFAPSIMRILKNENRLVEIASQTGADRLSIHYSLATKKLMKESGVARLPVTTWTVDDSRELKRLTDFGVDSVISNDPRNMLSARGHKPPGVMLEPQKSIL